MNKLKTMWKFRTKFDLYISIIGGILTPLGMIWLFFSIGEGLLIILLGEIIDLPIRLEKRLKNDN